MSMPGMSTPGMSASGSSAVDPTSSVASPSVSEPSAVPSSVPEAPRVASSRREEALSEPIASASLPPPTSPAASAAPSAPGDSSEPAAGIGSEASPETADTTDTADTARTVKPRPLSLDELGVGTVNPFIGDEIAKPGGAGGRGREGSVAASARKLEQSIETALARRDQRIGLGPEGPVVAAVETLVMQSTTTPDSDATLFVRTDAEGKVVHAEVRVASSDGPEWERIARELVRSLGDKRMRVPAGSSGVSFQLQVTSREQLPSGASPGLEISVLGATLKRGRGDRPTKIAILEPKIGTQKVPLPHDPMGREVDAIVVSLVPFALFGDPVDIAAPARRVVRAHLRDLTVH
jgi:hypothetical protein